MLRRLARSLVMTYPQPWRDRYGDEVLALIEDSPVRFRDLGELVRGLIVERARALIEDADHPTRTPAILASLHPAFVIGFLAAAWVVGLVLRGSFGGLIQWRPASPGPRTKHVST